jgi:hypothetical protein
VDAALETRTSISNSVGPCTLYAARTHPPLGTQAARALLPRDPLPGRCAPKPRCGSTLHEPLFRSRSGSTASQLGSYQLPRRAHASRLSRTRYPILHATGASTTFACSSAALRSTVCHRSDAAYPPLLHSPCSIPPGLSSYRYGFLRCLLSAIQAPRPVCAGVRAEVRMRGMVGSARNRQHEGTAGRAARMRAKKTRRAMQGCVVVI